jgi:sortase A
MVWFLWENTTSCVGSHTPRVGTNFKLLLLVGSRIAPFRSEMTVRVTKPALWWRVAQWFFLLSGCLLLGYCALVYFEARLYQALETRRLENPPKTPATTPATTVRAAIERTLERAAEKATGLPSGTLRSTSRIEIPRLGISSAIVEGVTSGDLTLAVGHIPGTALPGETGNIALAGHRDTFFRNLRNIRTGDRITLSTAGASYHYSVESISVVGPEYVQVLNASSEPTLTLITCYPFSFVGPAPRRFIVQARVVSRQ